MCFDRENEGCGLDRRDFLIGGAAAFAVGAIGAEAAAEKRSSRRRGSWMTLPSNTARSPSSMAGRKHLTDFWLGRRLMAPSRPFWSSQETASAKSIFPTPASPWHWPDLLDSPRIPFIPYRTMRRRMRTMKKPSGTTQSTTSSKIFR
jgi:hypothetical protein